jgi:hypothetical protein
MPVKIFRTPRADQQIRSRAKSEQKKDDNRDPEVNVYAELYRLVGHELPPSERRTKPPCCGPDGSAPAFGPAAEDLARRATEIRRTRR